MMDRLKNEPVMVLGVIQALVALVTAFGLQLSGDQVATITALSAAVLSLIARTQVTPTRKL